VDYNGKQYWTSEVTIIAHEENSLEINLDQLALDEINNPNPIRFDGFPPIYRKEGIKVATIGSLVGLLAQVNLGDSNPGIVYYYVNDHLAMPQMMVDNQGQVVWQADYDPFGAASVDAGSTAVNQHRFPGQYEDVETQLHYNYHRYYDPRSGRYLTPDPIGINGGINLFAYVKNNPVVLKDVLGLDCDIEFCVLAPAFMPDWWPTMGGPYDHAYLKVGNYGAYGFTLGPNDTIETAHVQPEPRVKDPRAKCFPVKRSSNLGCECRSCESILHCVIGNIEVGALHPYNFLKYNCWDWATQSVEKCCMKVSTPWYMNPAHVRDDFY
jgi:RHS repeat-associated protein